MTGPLFAAQHGWIRVTGAEPLLSALQNLAPAWPTRQRQGRSRVVASIAALSEPEGWRFTCDAYAVPEFRFSDSLAAANGLLGTLIGCMVALEPRIAALHAASVQVPGGLLLLLGENGAGKSTLSVALAMRGYRFVGDDRLLVQFTRRPRGIGLQLTAKLRLPLPGGAGPGFGEFVAARAVLQAEGMSLIRFRPEEILPRGQSVRLHAAILLERDGMSQPELRPLSRTDLLDALLEGCFAPQLTAVERLQALLPLADLPGYALSYADSTAAAARLGEQFA